MEHLKDIKQKLVELVQEQLENVENVDTCELGQVIDMIKDLSESIYYCEITHAMETGGKINQTVDTMMIK